MKLFLDICTVFCRIKKMHMLAYTLSTLIAMSSGTYERGTFTKQVGTKPCSRVLFHQENEQIMPNNVETHHMHNRSCIPHLLVVCLIYMKSSLCHVLLASRLQRYW